MFTWNVFIQIETVALKAVGLPEEGTLRIGGRRERLRTIPSMPNGTLFEDDQVQTGVPGTRVCNPKKDCSIRSNGKHQRSMVGAYAFAHPLLLSLHMMHALTIVVAKKSSRFPSRLSLCALRLSLHPGPIQAADRVLGTGQRLPRSGCLGVQVFNDHFGLLGHKVRPGLFPHRPHQIKLLTVLILAFFLVSTMPGRGGAAGRNGASEMLCGSCPDGAGFTGGRQEPSNSPPPPLPPSR